MLECVTSVSWQLFPYLLLICNLLLSERYRLCLRFKQWKNHWRINSKQRFFSWWMETKIVENGKVWVAVACTMKASSAYLKWHHSTKLLHVYFTMISFLLSPDSSLLFEGTLLHLLLNSQHLISPSKVLLVNQRSH